MYNVYLLIDVPHVIAESVQIIMVKDKMQMQTAVTAYFSSKQLLLFVFARHNRLYLPVMFHWYYAVFSEIAVAY